MSSNFPLDVLHREFSNHKVFVLLGVQVGFVFRHKYNNQGPGCRRICMGFSYVSRFKIYPEFPPRKYFFFLLGGVEWGGR